MDRREWLQLFLTKGDYQKEVEKAFLSLYDVVMASSSSEAFRGLLERYEKETAGKLKELLPLCDAIADEVGVSRYTLQFLLMALMAEHLLVLYQEKGISEEIFWHTMMDLYYKNEECLAVYGLYGTFVGSWVIEAFDCSRVGLGRLQFELVPFRHTYERNGVTLGPEDLVVNVHIPRDGTPLKKEATDEAFRMAAQYFASTFPHGPVVFVCDSWLLYPGNLEIIPPNSNLRSFYAYFDILSSSSSGDSRENMWRLFDTLEVNPKRLPEDTSLRRAFKKHLLSGGVTGVGFGVYVYNK